jgi:hypothetical protein
MNLTAYGEEQEVIWNLQLKNEHNIKDGNDIQIFPFLILTDNI